MTSTLVQLTTTEFLKPVIRRNTSVDGSIKDPDLMRRLENPICLKCQDDYKKKFPGKPFNIICKGIYDQKNVEDLVQKTNLSKEEVEEIILPVAWANKHIKAFDEKGNANPFIARDYQIPILACTAERKVDRMGRGLGKTQCAVIEELHKAMKNKNYPILVLCPAKSQAQKWYDDILMQCEMDGDLGDAIKAKRQQPFFKIEFYNGSTISIFTAGSSSGRDADVIRSQSPRRVRLEEQDLLNEGDYRAVMPLLRRYKGSEFHGSSTPTGARSTYWAMCTQFSDYKEFYAPIMVDPNWSTDMEEHCRQEARTDDVYRHEFLAEFGDLAQGVFKSFHIDLSRTSYRYKMCKYDPKMFYVMGVDWNGQGTGTRIRILEYDPQTQVRKVVCAESVEGPAVTTTDSIDKIRMLNRYWHCSGIYLDAGFGHVQDELLRLAGKNAQDPADRKLVDVKIIDFGARIETNKLVPNRGNSKYIGDNELERRTKPFMVEGAVMVLEQGLFRFSDIDDLLDIQLRSYKVKTWSQHGTANTYTAGKEGDHDLDATMLALLGVELQYGLFNQPRRNRLAKWTHAAQFGGGPSDPAEQAQLLAEQKERAESIDVPTRQVKEKEEGPEVILPGSGILIAPPKNNAKTRVPSRTAIFKSRNVGAPSRSGKSPRGMFPGWPGFPK